MNTGGTVVYKYKGIEYVARPLELELTVSKVLYLHDTTTGVTVLRICRIPGELISYLPSLSLWKVLTIDLVIVRAELGGEVPRGIKTSPVFLEVSEAGEYFVVVDEAGNIILEVLSVPQHLLASLKNYEFADITCGYTGKEE